MHPDSVSVQVTASKTDDSMTVQMNTRFGAVSFTCSPLAIEAGLADLVSEVLADLEDSEPSLLARLSRDSDLPADLVKENFEVYRRRQNTKFPNDAIDELSPGNKAYVRGTLEQFSEGIAPGIALMLDHLAVASLTGNVSDVDHQWRGRVQQSHAEFREVLLEHFKRSIQSLWDRQPEN